MIEYEKFEFKEIARLDKGRPNSSLVEVLYQTPKRMFSTVTSSRGGAEWEVMTNRLTKIK